MAFKDLRDKTKKIEDLAEIVEQARLNYNQTRESYEQDYKQYRKEASENIDNGYANASDNLQVILHKAATIDRQDIETARRKGVLISKYATQKKEFFQALQKFVDTYEKYSGTSAEKPVAPIAPAAPITERKEPKQELERRLVYNAILDKTEREKIISKYGLTDQQYTELKTELDSALKSRAQNSDIIADAEKLLKETGRFSIKDLQHNSYSADNPLYDLNKETERIRQIVKTHVLPVNDLVKVDGYYTLKKEDKIILDEKTKKEISEAIDILGEESETINTQIILDLLNIENHDGKESIELYLGKLEKEGKLSRIEHGEREDTVADTSNYTLKKKEIEGSEIKLYDGDLVKKIESSEFILKQRFTVNEVKSELGFYNDNVKAILTNGHFFMNDYTYEQPSDDESGSFYVSVKNPEEEKIGKTDVKRNQKIFTVLRDWNGSPNRKQKKLFEELGLEYVPKKRNGHGEIRRTDNPHLKKTVSSTPSSNNTGRDMARQIIQHLLD